MLSKLGEMNLFTCICNSYLIFTSISPTMIGTTGVSGNTSLHSPMVLTSAAMQKAAKHQERERDKRAYNLRIKDLKQRFNEEVDSIAQEFSGQGVHRSVRQIRKQVLFSMGQQAKTCKPLTYNAWAHAEVQAERLGGMLKTRTLGRSLG